MEQRAGGRVREQAQARKASGLRQGRLRAAAGEDAGRLKAARSAVWERMDRFTKMSTEPNYATYRRSKDWQNALRSEKREKVKISELAAILKF
jgi:hypothetical protein